MSPNNNEFNRRDVLKKAVAGSVALGTIGLGSSSAAGEGLPDDTDISIEEYNTIDEGEIGQYRDIVQNHSAIGLFEEKFAEYGLEARGASGFEVVTDDPEVNEADPMIVMLGYAEEGPGRTERGRSRSRGKSSGNISGNSGAVVAQLEEHDGSTTVVSAVPYIAEEVPGRADDGGKEYTIKTLAPPQNNDSPISAQSNTLDDLEVEEQVQDTINVKNSELTQNTGDGVEAQGEGDLIKVLCGGLCAPIVTYICDKATDGVDKTLCVKACWRFVTNPYLLGACGSICLILIDFISDKGCVAGAGTICTAFCSEV